MKKLKEIHFSNNQIGLLDEERHQIVIMVWLDSCEDANNVDLLLSGLEEQYLLYVAREE